MEFFAGFSNGWKETFMSGDQVCIFYFTTKKNIKTIKFFECFDQKLMNYIFKNFKSGTLGLSRWPHC